MLTHPCMPPPAEEECLEEQEPLRGPAHFDMWRALEVLQQKLQEGTVTLLEELQDQLL